MKIILSKPIPEQGRIPTAAECSQFRKTAYNSQQTRSGGWKIGWNDRKDGGKEPCISYFDRRTRSGEGWYFEIILPEPNPTAEKRRTIPNDNILSHTDRESNPPAAWFW